MCGIVGIASRNTCTHRAWLAEGCDSLRHRGPDDAGEWWSDDGRVGLAQRRLAIIDLSSAGHQPMHDVSEALSIVFNGELYNFRELRSELQCEGYRFRTKSDTEVLLASYDAWGTDCLSRLNGMFAFALYDARRQVLFLARDRAGEKPLFYNLADGTLCFASELKALLTQPTLHRRIDKVAMDCYLAFGYVPGDRCILQGFNKLPPAHALSFDLASGKAQVWRYWKVPRFEGQTEYGSREEADLVDELEVLLEDAVGKQLEADVPVGVLLSGGVDSSLVTAMAVRRSSNVRTFCIGFPGHGAMDETKHAQLIARHFGTEHMELMAEPTTADLVPYLARQFDEPMVDSSMIPTWLVCNLVRQHCTVALGGDGGDELFGGYRHHSRLLWMQSRFGRLPLSIRKMIKSGATSLLPVGLKGRNWLQGLGTDLSHGLPLIASYFDAKTRRKLLCGTTPGDSSAEQIHEARIPLEADLLQRATRMDFGNYLVEDILVKVDRASMSNSLEVRAPLLDFRLIEFAFKRVPSSLKATSTDRKIILKRLCDRVLPADFNKHRKQGFSIPLNSWLKNGPFRDLFCDVLLDPQSIFDHRVVTSLLRGQDQGRKNSERLFALVQFELWRQEYGASL